MSAEFFQYPCIWGLCPPPPSPIFSCKKFRFEPLILKQNIYPHPTHHTSPMYDTIREDNDHIVEIYISLCAKCSCRVEKCVCSKTCTREHSAPASAQNILPRWGVKVSNCVTTPPATDPSSSEISYYYTHTGEDK